MAMTKRHSGTLEKQPSQSLDKRHSGTLEKQPSQALDGTP